MKIADVYTKFIQANNRVATDTRDMEKGSLFFCWKGEEFNGNAFAEQALAKGASCVVVDDINFYVDNDQYLLVEDSIATLQKLAKYHRDQYDIPVIGLTGSNGKTTSKEMINVVLSQKYNTIATAGNLNNHVGVPKTLLRINPDTEIAIIEMGANHIGEIRDLANIAKPTHVVVTNIGRAHLGLFGGYEGVIQAKTELYDFARLCNAKVFVNNGDQLLIDESLGIEDRILYGVGTEYTLENVKNNPFVSAEYRQEKLRTQLVGAYNTVNLELALAVSAYFNVEDSKAINALSLYRPDNQRSEYFNNNGMEIIKDYYNANRSSMELALRNFANIETPKPKIVILGDMFELGEYEAEDHRFVTDLAIELGFNEIHLVGEAFFSLKKDTPEALFYSSTDEYIEITNSAKLADSYILMKSSQGMHFNKIFKAITK